jgi:ornithine carbamoyltransferase
MSGAPSGGCRPYFTANEDIWMVNDALQGMSPNARHMYCLPLHYGMEIDRLYY